MNFEFSKNQKYTLVAIGGGAFTSRSEMQTLEMDPASGRMICKVGRKRKRYYAPSDLKDILVFQGHGLPFILDSETSSFVGNAQFNFVTDDPKGLKEFISEKCLNRTEQSFSNILVWGTDRSNIDLQTSNPLFDAEELAQLFTSAAA